MWHEDVPHRESLSFHSLGSAQPADGAGNYMSVMWAGMGSEGGTGLSDINGRLRLRIFAGKP